MEQSAIEIKPNAVRGKGNQLLVLYPCKMCGAIFIATCDKITKHVNNNCLVKEKKMPRDSSS